MITYIVILWCVQHFTVSSTLMCSELYCVQNLTLSSTLLCPTHYCGKQNTVSTLTQKIFCPPFTFQRAAVLLCACEAPLLNVVNYIVIMFLASVLTFFLKSITMLDLK